MFAKILIVSLVQVALARHVPDGPLFRTEYNSESQFSYPGTESLDAVHFDADLDGNYRTGHYEPYVENNNHATFQRGRERAINYGLQKHERPEATVNNQNDNRRNRYIQGPDKQLKQQTATNIENISVKHSNQRLHGTNTQNNRARFQKCDQTHPDKQNTLKTNLDSESNISDSASNETFEYNAQGNDSSYHQNGEEGVKTNEKSNNNSGDQFPVSSKSADTNLNIHNRFKNTQPSNDSLPEVGRNSMIFIDRDNPKPNGPVKTTTDNELRYNTNDDNKDEIWVWGDASTTEPPATTTTPPPTAIPPPATTSSNKTEPASDLDDRTSLNGDACPKGQAKVLGQCIDKHG